MNNDKLKEILEKHDKWLKDEQGGERANLSNTYLSGADLNGAYLINADLRRANLSDADLSGAYLNYANLSNANLSDADLSGAYLNYANLINAYLMSADLRGANLSDANLRGANLSDANLSNTYLSGAYLYRASLRGADLSGADLRDATITKNKIKLIGEKPVVQISPLGFETNCLIAYNTEKGIYITQGCTKETPLAKYRKKVEEVYEGSEYAKQYYNALNFIEENFKNG